MTTDKLFVLLLVILLPLTGCLDIADNAEAEESNDETTIVNNYYNNTTTTTMPMVHSLHLEKGENATLQFDGTSTLKLETIYHGGYGSQAPSSMTVMNYFDMTCDGTLMVDGGTLERGHYLPVLGGQSCTIVFDANIPYFLIFSEASLSAL